MSTPYVDHVQVDETVDSMGQAWRVMPVWIDFDVCLDRRVSSGWRVHNKRLVPRLVAAIEAGVVCADPEVKVDKNGHTYVNFKHVVSGKRMNADLKRLGF